MALTANTRPQACVSLHGQHEGGIMLPSDIYSQAQAADPVLDARMVLDLVRRHGVRCSAVTSIDETGGEARAYGLDGLCTKSPVRNLTQRS
jgi:hypothetical protein